MKVQCEVEWELEEPLSTDGAFGDVYAATGPDGQRAAVKLVRKDPGAEREFLFVELGDARNVVPIIDRGETDESYVLVMPLAESSLEQVLRLGEALPIEQVIQVLIDIATALVDISPVVVHRDLKPDNILLLDGVWCLADFGISRYAEAATATDTRKDFLTAPYAAPEQWRRERAISATDIYAFGVVAYRLLAGELPFPGPTPEDFREQHLHADPPALPGVPSNLAALVTLCLMKAPEARPMPADILGRLERALSSPRLSVAHDLAAANQAEAQRHAEASRAASEARTATERREELAQSGTVLYGLLANELLDVIRENASTATINPLSDRGWIVTFGDATLQMTGARSVTQGEWGGHPPPVIDVVCEGSIALRFPSDPWGYQGRSHSLFYCDAVEGGAYAWFETAFTSVWTAPANTNPFAMATGTGAAVALTPGLQQFQVAWPFTKLVPGEADEFVERWLGWFVAASQGQLHRPSQSSEGNAPGSWRQF